VRVDSEERDGALVLLLHVAPDDVGKVVGQEAVGADGPDGLVQVTELDRAGVERDAAQDEAMQGAVGVTMNDFTTGWSDWLGKRFG